MAVSVFARSGSTSVSPAAHSPPPGLPYAAIDAGYAFIGARHLAVQPARERRRNREALSPRARPPASRRPSTGACRSACAPAPGRGRCPARPARDSPSRGDCAVDLPVRVQVHRRRRLARAPSRGSRTSSPCRRGVRTTMKPPPPMLPANGCVTASANAVATAASTALPPFASTAAPTSDASSEDDTTTPVFEGRPKSVWAAPVEGPAAPTSPSTTTEASIFLMAFSLTGFSLYPCPPQVRCPGPAKSRPLRLNRSGA